MSALDHVVFVLSRPSEPRNIGASCRAMMNSGLSRLRLVLDESADLDAARPLAVNSLDLLDRAERYDSLADAVAGAVLVVGVTRRVGQKRKETSHAPWELADLVRRTDGGTIAVVFGNEQSGLTDEELARCQVAVSIPAAPEQPSLNLSHAVQVIGYELHKATRVELPKRTHVPMTTEAIDETVSAITESLASIGYHTQDGPQGMPSLLRDLLARASVSHREARRLCALFDKIAGMCRGRDRT